MIATLHGASNSETASIHRIASRSAALSNPATSLATRRRTAFARGSGTTSRNSRSPCVRRRSRIALIRSAACAIVSSSSVTRYRNALQPEIQGGTRSDPQRDRGAGRANLSRQQEPAAPPAGDRQTVAGRHSVWDPCNVQLGISGRPPGNDLGAVEKSNGARSAVYPQGHGSTTGGTSSMWPSELQQLQALRREIRLRPRQTRHRRRCCRLSAQHLVPTRTAPNAPGTWCRRRAPATSGETPICCKWRICAGATPCSSFAPMRITPAPR